jgi:hypothetical protein
VEAKKKTPNSKIEQFVQTCRLVEMHNIMPKVDANSYYYNKDLVCVKNECTYIDHDWPSIFNKLLAYVPIE